MTSPPATSSDTINNGSKLPEKRKASAVCTLRSLHIGKSGTHFVRDVTFSGCSAPSWHRPLLLELNGETEVSHSVTATYLNEAEKSFVLNEGEYDSRILYWGQMTTAGKCTLNFYGGDELVTVELTTHKLE